MGLGRSACRMLGTGDLWITEYTITYRGRPYIHREHHGVPQ
jgi:hypothetical protein